jgi:hypothetical protein
MCFAAAKRPRNPEEALHHCPAPNVFASGKICLGDHSFARDPLKLPAEFFLSQFRVTGDTRAGKAREPADGELLVAAAGAHALVEPQLDETGSGNWQPQQASGCAVRAPPIPDAVVEVHSHHEVALRLATGCKPHAVEPVPFRPGLSG